MILAAPYTNQQHKPMACDAVVRATSNFWCLQPAGQNAPIITSEIPKSTAPSLVNSETSFSPVSSGGLVQ